MANASLRFAAALEQCIRDQAVTIAATAGQWGDRCMSPTSKMVLQVNAMHAVLAPMFAEHGYTGAAWCTFYTTVMRDEPFFRDWRDHMLCPWREDAACLHDPLGKHGDERLGVAQITGRDGRTVDGNFNRGETRLDTRVMSCGLCGHLERALGTGAAFRQPFPPAYYAPRLQAHRAVQSCAEGRCHGWWSEWDMHTFGAWLGQVTDPSDVRATMETVHRYRLTNGEEVHMRTQR